MSTVRTILCILEVQPKRGLSPIWAPDAWRPDAISYSQNRGQRGFPAALLGVLCVAIGVIDFGRAFWYSNTLAEAVREGARYAAYQGRDALEAADLDGPSGSQKTSGSDAKVTAEVQRFAYGLNPSLLTVITRWPDDNNSLGSSVEVEGHYSYKPVTSWIAGRATISFSAKSSRKIQYLPWAATPFGASRQQLQQTSSGY